MTQNITDILGLIEETINVLQSIDNDLQSIEENLSSSNKYFEHIDKKISQYLF